MTMNRLTALAQAEYLGTITPTQKAELDQIRAQIDKSNNYIASVVEPALTVATGALAEPISGFVGLAGLPFGVDASTNAIRRTQEALTYQPRTQSGQAGLQAVGQALAPIGEAIEGASSYLGDKTLEATGSPGLATAAYSIPTFGLEALGLKGANVAGKAGKLGKQFEMGDVHGQAFGQRGAVAGAGKGKFDVRKVDESEWAGEGAESIRYTDPDTGGTMQVLVRPNQARGASVLELYVPDEHRRKGVAKSLLNEVMANHPSLMGQVSSKHAARNAYKMGRRPIDKPDATLEDVFKIIDEWSSVNMATPE